MGGNYARAARHMGRGFVPLVSKSMHASGQFWVIFILGVVLKVPIFILGWVLWRAFRVRDQQNPPSDPVISRMALCAYCGSRITIGYDAELLHRQAVLVSESTGEGTFDIESRLIRAAVGQPRHYPDEPDFCPDCGEQTTWAPIEPIDLSGVAVTPGRRG